MYFLYLKSDGVISPPILKGEPETETVNKELNCSLGSGIKWNNVDVFYAPNSEFPDDFQENAPFGKYYIGESGEVEETTGWEPPPKEESEWL